MLEGCFCLYINALAVCMRTVTVTVSSTCYSVTAMLHYTQYRVESCT